MTDNDLKARIEGKYAIDPETGCWNWTRSVIGNGYGQLNVRCMGDRYAHRASYRAFKGEIPAGASVLHRCDNRLCVNPQHLFLGSSADNAQDMKAKDRHLFGERNAKAVLTEHQVREIHSLHRGEGISTYRLAKQFRVSQGTIWKILHGQRWSHIAARLAQSESQ